MRWFIAVEAVEVNPVRTENIFDCRHRLRCFAQYYRTTNSRERCWIALSR